MKKTEKQENLKNSSSQNNGRQINLSEIEISEVELTLKLRQTVKNQPVPSDLEAKVLQLIKQLK